MRLPLLSMFLSRAGAPGKDDDLIRDEGHISQPNTQPLPK